MDRNQFVLDHLYLVKQELWKLAPPPDWAEDLYQEGVIGLIHATNKLDLNRPKFSAYLRKYVRGAMLKVQFGLVYVPRNARMACREDASRSIEEVAADDRNFHTVKSLEAARRALHATFVEYDDNQDHTDFALARLELADQLEKLIDLGELTQLQLRALEARVTDSCSLAELDRIHQTSRSAHSHALCRVKQKSKEKRI